MGRLGLRRNALAAVVVFRQLEAAARAPAGVVRKLVGQRVLLLRNKCPEARQRAVPLHLDKFCFADITVAAFPAAPAGKDPLAGNRSVIYRACSVDGLIYFQVFRNIIRAAVDDRTSFGKRYPVLVQQFFRRAFPFFGCPPIRHRMRGGKAGVDRLHALSLCCISICCLIADELVGIAVQLLIPADKAVTILGRRSRRDLLVGLRIVVGDRSIRFCCNSRSVALSYCNAAALRILPDISAHRTVFPHPRGGDKALAPLPLGDERRAAGFELRRLAICGKGKGFACRVIAHGVDRGQHFIVSCQQPAVEAPAILCWFGRL